MDIKRPDIARKQRVRRISVSALSSILLIGALVFLFFFRAGPYKVEQDEVWIGTVSQGSMMLSVRAIGTLEPDEIRWIAAETSGRIERVLILPGAHVDKDDIILEMSNPELVQQTGALALQLESERSNFISFKVNLQNEIMQLESSLSQLEADHELAVLEAQINEDLFNDGIESKLNMKRSELQVRQLVSRIAAEKQRLAFQEKAVAAQISAEESKIKQTEARLQLLERQLDNLKVRAGFNGVLQKQSVEVGQQIAPGVSLAQVANPKSLKAVLRVPEHQAKDVSIGLTATIDTRNGKVAGQVTRVDPNVVEGSVAVDIDLPAELPDGVRPDLNVEGLIEIEQVNDTLYVDRPAYARSNSTTSLFRFEADTNVATRTTVLFGKSGSNTIEVISGLQTGDRIILSDTSAWEEHDQIQID